MSQKRVNIIALCIFAVAVFALKWETVHDPYVWDDMVEAAVPALDMMENNFRLVHPKYNFGHPPLQPILLALTWQIFGYSIAAAHTFIFVFGVFGLWATYLLAQHFFGTRAGFGAAILLLFNPLFFTHLGLQTDAIPLLTFGVLTVLAYVKNKPLLTTVFGSLLLLTKETGLMVIIGLLFYALYLQLQPERLWSIIWDPSRPKVNRFLRAVARLLKKDWCLLAPVFWLFFWFAYVRLTLGWALRRDLFINFGDFFTILLHDFTRYFVFDFGKPTSIVFGVITVLIIFHCLRDKGFRGRLVLPVAIIFAHLFLFAFTFSAPRYYPVVIAFYCVAGAGAIHQSLKSKSPVWFYAALSVAGALSVPLLYDPQEREDYSMGYGNSIQVNQAAADYLTAVFPGRLIITEWPFTDILREPRLGYVKSPFAILDAGLHRRQFFVEGTNNFNRDYLLLQEGAVLIADWGTSNITFKAMARDPRVQLRETFAYENKLIGVFEIGSGLGVGDEFIKILKQ